LPLAHASGYQAALARIGYQNEVSSHLTDARASVSGDVLSEI
jgi:hypothetical protein